VTIWFGMRQPESLPVEKRRPLSALAIRSALGEIARHPMVRLSILIQTLGFAMLFTVIISTQQVFDLTFGYGDTFHLWFGAIALVAGSASILNAALVVRLGMRKLVSAMLLVQVFLSAVMIILWVIGLPMHLLFAAYVVWTFSLFFQAGLIIGNLNALAMEPMGHIAGIAASAIGAFSTIGAVVLVVPVGLAFDGTPLPIAIGIFCEAVLAYLLIRRMQKLERPGEIKVG